MKALIIAQCGTKPENPKSWIKMSAKINSSDGQAAYEKFKGILGEEFSLGVVIHAPTSSPDVILKHLKMDMLNEGKPPFVNLSTLAHSDGFYGYANINLDEAGLPPSLLNLQLNTAANISIELTSEKSGEDIINFINSEPDLDSDKACSRLYCSLSSNFRMECKIDVPPEIVGEIYSQIIGLIPIPLPVDPMIGAKIIENLEIELDTDSLETLPKTFLNEFWDDRRIDIVQKIAQAYWNNLDPIGGENNLEALAEVSNCLSPKTLYAHLFSKNWGHVTLEITAPGLHSLVDNIKEHLQINSYWLWFLNKLIYKNIGFSAIFQICVIKQIQKEKKNLTQILNRFFFQFKQQSDLNVYGGFDIILLIKMPTSKLVIYFLKKEKIHRLF